MGRRNKAYYKDLHQQAYDKLVGMQAFGESKRAAVAAGTDKEKISLSTPTRATGSTPSIYPVHQGASPGMYHAEKAPGSTSTSGCRPGPTRGFPPGRYSWRPRPWASCTAFLPTMKTTSSPQSGTGRISSGAAVTGCATGTFPRPTTTS